METIKVVVLGDKSVGKTSLIKRFALNTFAPEISTIGVDMHTKILTINGKAYKVSLWDTAGAEEFRSITAQYYRNAAGAVLVYDVSCSDSLAKLDGWIGDLKRYSDNPNIAIMVVGNKSDMERVVQPNDGLKFARKHDALFMETSAKNGNNVCELFEDVAKQSVKFLKEAPVDTIKIQTTEPTTASCPCC